MMPANKAMLKRAAWMYAVIVFASFSPCLLSTGTACIASLFGIELNIGRPPAIGGFAGPLVSGILYWCLECGLYALITLPLGALAFLGYTFYLLAGLILGNGPAKTHPQE
jgi:hypothetical protein